MCSGEQRTIGPFLRMVLTLVIVAGSAQAQAVHAQEVSGRGAWEVAPFLSGWDDFPEFGPNDNDTFVDPERGLLFGTRFGYHWTTGLFLESEVGYVSLETQLTDRTRGGLNLLLLGASLGYDLPLSHDFELFTSAGVGSSRWGAESVDSETDLTLRLGTGARWFLTENFGLRFDAKLLHTPNALERTTAALGESFPGESLTAWSLGGGVSIRWGGVRDSDGDGVGDSVDSCAGTPRGVRVDASGCPLDSDGDGVLNHMDDCANTLRGTEVDARGCAVPQPDPEPLRESMPQPESEPTPEPEALQESIQEPVPEPIVVENVLFDVDSSALDEAARLVLDRAGPRIRERRSVLIELDGHTDSTASEMHNQRLGELRANAVMDYLMTRFGISEEHFELQSFGESDPAADNGTADGRRMNRRVEIRVQG